MVSIMDRDEYLKERRDVGRSRAFWGVDEGKLSSRGDERSISLGGVVYRHHHQSSQSSLGVTITIILLLVFKDWL